ncbi:MAG TPA: hypothetical protein VJ882_02680 [Desulfuromonadales bacterium]|nr:hypothetical protein [Desulfuromonadales bacterium]
MEKCPVCKEEKKGKYWCDACKTVFVCPMQNCGVQIRKRDAKECPQCGLFFEDFVERRKMYRRCPKCGKKQGLSESQCRHCNHWFSCPTCGHNIKTTSSLTCPRCATDLRR